jgi:glyoxylase-like metal-dependent hydrolase (beta-lactamase superfamily II)
MSAARNQKISTGNNEEVSENVFRIALSHPFRDFPVYCYLIKGRQSSALIDSGWGEERSKRELFAQLKEIGADPQKVKEVVITHAHPDHYGLAGEFQRECGASILLHENDLCLVRLANLDNYRSEMEKWLSKYVADPSEVSRPSNLRNFAPSLPIARPDVLLHGGEHLELGDVKVRVLHTPGHSPGHISLYQEGKTKLLFTGDHLIRNISPHVGLSLLYDKDPLGDYLESLMNVGKLDALVALPAHGPIFGNVNARIAEIEEHHKKRSQEILVALEAGKVAALDIAKSVSWSSGKFTDMAPWTRLQALTETLAHLRHLEMGKLAREETRSDGIIVFSRK